MRSQHVLNIQKILVLNIAACLIVLALFLHNLDIKSALKIHLKNERSFDATTKVISHQFSYIKPFTALVRFHPKLSKVTETKNREQKISFLNLPLLHLKLF